MVLKFNLMADTLPRKVSQFDIWTVEHNTLESVS